MSAPDLRVGDEVRVFDQNGRRMGQPDAGWPGTVTKIGRLLVTIEYRGKSAQFRLDTQVVNDGYGHRYFKTLQQAARHQRLGRALYTLHEHQIRLAVGHRLTLEQIEALADVARKF
ncbi:hypothetical protein AB0K34_14170 [Actinomadura sp. NPDC049382]|uniref:beta barrel domain-containing protein n=1 Tax=Actinomadura sp. NPDC049382 TaxID=3158220 RepID=UPI00342AB2EC